MGITKRVKRKVSLTAQKQIQKIKDIGETTKILHKSWDFRMGWRFVSYIEEEKWLSFEIEPMYQNSCIIRVPSKEIWEKFAPEWAQNRRGEILKKLRNIEWNRDLSWSESIQHQFCKIPKGRMHPGSFESSRLGRELEMKLLFHPQNSKTEPRESAKQHYYRTLKQYIQKTKGEIRLNPELSSPGSVFREVEWVAYQNNPNIQVYTNH